MPLFILQFSEKLALFFIMFLLRILWLKKPRLPHTFIKSSNCFTVTGHKEGVVLSWELTEKLHWYFRCLSQKYTLSNCFMAPGRRAFPMLSACMCFLGLFSNAECSTGPDRSCLIQQIPEGDAGCAFPRGWMTCRRGNNLHSIDGSQAASGKGCRKWEGVSLSAHSVNGTSKCGTFSNGSPSKSWLRFTNMDALGLLFNMQNMKHSVICSRDMKYLVLITLLLTVNMSIFILANFCV